jgi:succinate-semialdehyde dehydrogenase/glutarate-semialdehyde dehydrogenase
MAVTHLPTSTGADVTAAAERARELQVEWANRPVADRAAVLLRFHDRLLDRVHPFVDMLQREAGKARLSATEEVLHCALTACYYARRADRYLRSERGHGVYPVLTRIDRHYLPKGLVGIIALWNYPLTMAISDGLAALVAGNAVIANRLSRLPLSASQRSSCWSNAACPPGCGRSCTGLATW